MNLHAGREADEVGTETEAGTLTSSETDRGAEEVEDGEDRRSNNGYDDDLLNLGELAGDDYHRNGDGKTLEEILDYASKEFSTRKTVHLSYTPGTEKISAVASNICLLCHALPAAPARLNLKINVCYTPRSRCP
jgi:hypothetical protein